MTFCDIVVEVRPARRTGRSTFPPGEIEVNGKKLIWNTEYYQVWERDVLLKQVSRYIGPRFIYKWIREQLKIQQPGQLRFEIEDI